MKIDLNVCRTCIRSRTGDFNDWDELAISCGLVYCPAEKMAWPINEEVPDTCFYMLEMVLGDDDDAKPKDLSQML